MINRIIADIYEQNQKIHQNFLIAVKALPATALDRKTETGWSLEGIVEHIAIVEAGVLKVCARLLAKAAAEGKTSDGSTNLSDNFLETTAANADTKLVAPDMVQPSGLLSMTEAIEKLNQNQVTMVEMRSQFEQFNSADYHFPHPYFGDLSAGEWLVLTGGHKHRHLKQIMRIAGVNPE